MLLTRRTSTTDTPASSLVSSLARGVSRAIPTMDRRAFLRRSGLGVGAGIAASQLTLIQKSEAASSTAGAEGAAKVEVKRSMKRSAVHAWRPDFDSVITATRRLRLSVTAPTSCVCN